MNSSLSALSDGYSSVWLPRPGRRVNRKGMTLVAIRSCTGEDSRVHHSEEQKHGGAREEG